MKTIKSIIIIGITACLTGLGLNSCDTSNADTPPTSKQMDVYVSQRTSFVNSEIAKVNACVVGWDKDNFRANQLSPSFDDLKQAYLNSLSFAGDLLSNPDLTYNNIVQVDSALSATGKAFNSNILLFDHRALNDAVTDANTLFYATPVGTASGMVSQDASTAFKNAITAASTVRNTVTATDIVTQSACNDLAAAKQIFINAIIP